MTGRSALLGSFRDLSPAARLLVVNPFGINLGFYMVLPFLAAHLGPRPVIIAGCALRVLTSGCSPCPPRLPASSRRRC